MESFTRDRSKFHLSSDHFVEVFNSKHSMVDQFHYLRTVMAIIENFQIKSIFFINKTFCSLSRRIFKQAGAEKTSDINGLAFV